MQRRQFLKQSGALGAFALGAMGMGCAGRLGTPGGSARPNILLILVDDAGWKDFGFHDSEVMTPNLNRLAAEGAVLDQYGCQWEEDAGEADVPPTLPAGVTFSASMNG